MGRTRPGRRCWIAQRRPDTGRAGKHLATALLTAFAMLFATGCDDLIVGSWGFNSSGQLGNGNFTNSSTPVAVDASGILLGQTVVDIAANRSGSCAVTATGTVACWGRIYYAGAYPNFTTEPTPTLIDTASLVPGALATQVAVGFSDECALASDGRVGCWGAGGTRVLQGVLAGQQVIQISLGWDHGCAIVEKTQGRAVACWGANAAGQLGDGTLEDSFEPIFVDTSGVLAGKSVEQVVTTAGSTCARTSDGMLACWGSNSAGQLGNGTNTDSPLPVAVTMGGALAGKQVNELGGTTGFQMCAVATDGSAACWGSNLFGQLGDGTKTDSSVPIMVKQVGALAGKKIAAVSMADDHACALLSDATAACWGGGQSGQLGNGANADSLVPVAVLPLPGPGGAPRPIVDLAAGGYHNLAIYENAPPSRYVTLDTPKRVVDTRGDVSVGGPIGAVGAGNPLVVDLSSVLPVGATAVAFNLTATAQTASGYAELAPAGAAPGASTLNWMGPQQTIANAYISRVSADRKVDVRVGSAGTAQLVLDVFGYFTPNDPAGGTFDTVGKRVFDSRDKVGMIPPGGEVRVNLYPTGMSPEWEPDAAAVNVTVTGTTNTGVLTVAATRSASSSAINWSGPNQTIANALITPMDGDFITVTNNSASGAAHVTVDLVGTFTNGGFGAKFYPIDPVRPYDSRVSPTGALTAGQSRMTTSPVPASAVAQVVNTTVTGTTGTGYVSLIPSYPATSMVNWYASPTTRANGSIVPSSGAFFREPGNTVRTIIGGTHSTDYLLDLGGYFR